MPPTGLSLLTHSFIVLLGLSKRLVEFTAEKMGWEVFKFKMNLYLRSKISDPLTSQAADSRPRRIFAYGIVLSVFLSISAILVIAVGSRLKTNSNIDFVANTLKSGFTQAEELVGKISIKKVSPSAISLKETKAEPREKYAFVLPISDEVQKINDIVYNYPARR